MSLEYWDLACPEGLEPPTYSLEGYCSIQLSYGQMGFRRERPTCCWRAYGALCDCAIAQP